MFVKITKAPQVINLTKIKSFEVDDKDVRFYTEGEPTSCYLSHYDTEYEAEYAYNKIVQALKDNAAIVEI